MKKNTLTIIFFLLLAHNINAQSVRVLAECTITYSVTLIERNDAKIDSTKFGNTISKTVYIKGNQSRVEVLSPTFSQSVIFDKATGNAVILRAIGNNKFITKLDNIKWKAQNNKFEGSTLSIISNETKTILGYECKKAKIQLKDGNSFTLYFAANIVPSVKEFEYQFKEVPGFVLEYESQDVNGQLVKYTATKINLNPVSLTKFDIPTNGYRILN
jgi:GLPGLI family protein